MYSLLLGSCFGARTLPESTQRAIVILLIYVISETSTGFQGPRGEHCLERFFQGMKHFHASMLIMCSESCYINFNREH